MLQRYAEYEDDDYWYHDDEGHEVLELAKELDGLTGYFQSDDASNVQMENIHNFAGIIPCSDVLLFLLFLLVLALLLLLILLLLLLLFLLLLEQSNY